MAFSDTGGIPKNVSEYALDQLAIGDRVWVEVVVADIQRKARTIYIENKELYPDLIRFAQIKKIIKNA